MRVRKRIPKNYIPAGSRMLVRQVTDTELSTILIVPDSVKNKSLLFEVLAKGRDCVDDQIQVGSFVYTGQFAPCHLKFPNEREWYSLNEVDVLGVVTEFEEEEGEIGGEQ